MVNMGSNKGLKHEINNDIQNKAQSRVSREGGFCGGLCNKAIIRKCCFLSPQGGFFIIREKGQIVGRFS